MVDFLNISGKKMHISTLKECSKDDGNTQHIEYMTESTYHASDFEGVRDEYCNDNGISGGVHAVDAATTLNKVGTLIEFKNGVLTRKKLEHLREQINDSYIITRDYLNISAKQILQDVDFILVFNANKNINLDIGTLTSNDIPPSMLEITKDITSRGSKEFIFFGLDVYREQFRNVRTLTKEVFNEELKKIGCL